MYWPSVQKFMLIRLGVNLDVVVYACCIAYFCLCENNNKDNCMQCDHTLWGPANVQWIEGAWPQTNSGAAVYVTWYEITWCDMIWCGILWHGVSWHGKAWYDVTCHGVAWHGIMGCDISWHGMAWIEFAVENRKTSTLPVIFSEWSLNSMEMLSY